jgi:hypothetical protein
MEINKVYSSYLASAFEPALFKRTADIMCKCLKTLHFDAIAFRGMSGSLFAPLVAYRLGKKMVMVRKDGDGNHSGMLTEGWRMVDRIVIIDDLICTGNTIQSLVRSLNLSRRDTQRDKEPVKIAGAFFYHEYNSYDGGIPLVLDAETQPMFEDIPIFSIQFTPNYNDDKKRTRFYCNNRVRNILKCKAPKENGGYTLIKA